MPVHPAIDICEGVLILNQAPPIQLNPRLELRADQIVEVGDRLECLLIKTRERELGQVLGPIIKIYVLNHRSCTLFFSTINRLVFKFSTFCLSPFIICDWLLFRLMFSVMDPVFICFFMNFYFENSATAFSYLMFFKRSCCCLSSSYRH